MAHQTKEVTLSHEHIRKLASLGVSPKTIAASMGMSFHTFYERLNTDPKLLSNYDQGLAELEIDVSKNLKQVACDPSHKHFVGAAIWYLKAKCGWREEQPFELKDVTSWEKVRIVQEALNQAINRLLVGKELSIEPKQIEEKANAVKAGKE